MGRGAWRQLLAAEPAVAVCRTSNRRSWLESGCCCRRQQGTPHPFAVCSRVIGVAPSLAASDRSQLLKHLCESSGLGLTAAASMAWIRHSFHNRWVWAAGGVGKRGQAWWSTGAPWFSLPCYIGHTYSCWSLPWGAVPKGAAATTPASQGLPPVNSVSCADMSAALSRAAGDRAVLRDMCRLFTSEVSTETEAGSGHGRQAQSRAFGGRTGQGGGKRGWGCGAGGGVAKAADAGAERGWRRC